MSRPTRDLKLKPDKPKTPKEAFAVVLRQRRKELGLTQLDLESDEAIDRSYISKLELAKREPNLSAIFVIAGKLKMTPAELITKVSSILSKS